MTSSLRTIIVGGDAESALLLKGVLTATPTTVVVGEFKGLPQAVHEGPARKPDLVIVELGRASCRERVYGPV